MTREVDTAYDPIQDDVSSTNVKTRKPSKRLPTVITNGRIFRELSDECASVIVSANEPPQLFVRDSTLVRVHRNGHGRFFIEKVNEDILTRILSRSADLVKKCGSGRRYFYEPSSPSRMIIRDLLVKDSWALPPIEGLVHCPCFRSDGSIITAPGYDWITGLYYDPPTELLDLNIPNNPSKTQVVNALQVIQDPLADFPFEDAASKANALGLFLTCFVRQMINGPIPMCLIDAPQKGTGKGLLADVITIIATGEATPISTEPTDDQELRKLITSKLDASSQFIVFDNINRKLDSGLLAAALTSYSWGDRLLGTNQITSLLQRMTWIATGNNIQLGGDIPRRCFWIRIDAKVSEPWLRDVKQFKYPHLRIWVKENRRSLIEASLTIIKAWFSAKQPASNCPKLGSFEEWCEVIGGILDFLGTSGFLSNTESLYAVMDAETPDWEPFLLAMNDHFSNSSASVKEVIASLKEVPSLMECLPSALLAGDFQNGLPDKLGVRLGKAFRERAGRRFGESQVHVERGPKDTHAKSATWRFVRG